MKDNRSSVRRVLAAFGTKAHLLMVGSLALLTVASPSAREVPGAVESAMTVSPTGMPVQIIPVPIPPGAGGLEPKLSLRYAGGLVNLGIGAGWVLQGQSRITLGPKNWDTDGSSKGVSLDGGDALFLDGERLVQVGHRVGSVVEYRKELDDASRIIGTLGADGNISALVLESKAGISTSFVPGPKITRGSSTVPFYFLPTRTRDRAGNFIDWEFVTAGFESNLTKVRYTGFAAPGQPAKPPFAEISLEYEAAPRPSVAYLFGVQVNRDLRLKAISASVTAKDIAAVAKPLRLELAYRDVEGPERFQLVSVTQRGVNGDTLPTLRLGYKPFEDKWLPVPALTLPADVSPDTSTAIYRLGKIKSAQGALVTGMLVAADAGSATIAKAFAVTPSGWVELPSKSPPLSFASADGRSLGTHFVDVDQDGLADMIQHDPSSGVARAFIQTDTGWREDPRFAPPIPLAEGSQDAELFQVDLDGDGRKDMVVVSPSGKLQALLSRSDGWTPMPGHELPGLSAGSFTVGALQCSGSASLLSLSSTGGIVSLNVRKFKHGTWSAPVRVWTAVADPDGRRPSIRPMRIDGSKCPAQLVSYTSQGREATALLEWSTDTPRVLPSSFDAPWWISAQGISLHARVGDWNGDGLDDLLVGQQMLDGKVLSYVLLQQRLSQAGDTVSWKLGFPGTVPPIRVASAAGAGADQTVLVADLNADGKDDLIQLPSRREAGGVAYLSGAAGWQRAWDFAPSTALAQKPSEQGSVRFVDLDGDGVADIVFGRGDGAEQRGAFINTGKGWTVASGYVPPRSLAKQGEAQTTATLIDINGDGLPDVIYAYLDSQRRPVLETYLNERAGGVARWGARSEPWKLPAPLTSVLDGDLGGRFVDLNGDGLPDVLWAFQNAAGAIETAAYVNTGSGWKSAGMNAPVAFAITRQPGESYNRSTNTQIFDVDGDRIPDLVASYIDPSGVMQSGVFRGTGTSFETTSAFSVPLALDASNRQGPVVFPMDLNGDGVMDFVQYGMGNVQAFMGTGAGWTSDAAWDFPQEAKSDVLGFAGARLADANGDGLPDLLYNVPQRDGSFNKGWFLNTGGGWKRGADNFAPPDPFIASDGTDAGTRLVDVNGDNTVDSVRVSGTTPDILSRSVALNPNTIPGYLISVERSEVITRFYYAALSEPDSRANGIYVAAMKGTYPVIPLTPAKPVVFRVTVDEGTAGSRSTDYAYSGFRYDLRNVMALGFERIARRELPSGLKYATDYHQRFGLIGLKASDKVVVVNADGQEKTLIETGKTWQVVERPTEAETSRPSRYLQAMLVQETTRRNDLMGKPLNGSTKAFLYDEWLNTVEVITVDSDNTRSVLGNDFGDGEARRFGRLARSTVIHSRPGSATLSRTSSFTYDAATLMLASETNFVGLPQFSLTKTYARDFRSNVTKVTQTAVALPTRTESSTFDFWGRSLVRTDNAAGHSGQRGFDASTSGATLDLPSVVRDANLLETRLEYDGFGRIASKTANDGVVVSFERFSGSKIPAPWLSDLDHSNAKRPANCRSEALGTRPAFHVPAGSAEAINVTTPGTPSRLESSKIFDASGRVIREVTVRTDGQNVRLVFRDFEYDPLGRIIARSQPYFSGDTSYWDGLAYDAMDRKVRETLYDGRCMTYAYAGNVVSRTDSLGHTSTVYLNNAGKPKRVVAPDGGVTSFEYDVMERVTAVISPMKARTDFRYDTAGNKIWTRDSDAGVIESRYDAYGQLRGQKLAAHALWSEFDYDLLGRMSRAWRPERIETWTYDPPGALGMLAGAQTVSQNLQVNRTYRDTFEYDVQARLRRKTSSFDTGPDGPRHVASLDTNYDAEGRIATLTYPSSVAGRPYQVSRSYSAESGQLTTVIDSRSTTPLWRLQSADASGRPTMVALGNGVKTTEKRDAGHSELKQSVVSTGAQLLSKRSYDYDGNGNLTERKEAISPWSESFNYDGSDRLKMVRNGSQTFTAEYDQGGRLTYKSDVGKYEYGCGAGPANGVCRITTDAGTRERIEYGDDGGMKTNGRYIAAYSSDNKATRIWTITKSGPASSLYSEFDYGPNGQRVFTRERGCAYPNCFGYRVKETLHMGFGDRVYFTVGETRLITDRYYIDAGAGAFMSIDVIDRSQSRGDERTGPATQVRYLHRDHLGSIHLTTDASGRVQERVRFNAWGTASGIRPEDDVVKGSAAAWTRGFSAHDHIPQLALVHMNGRVYDPRLGVFLSADPITTDPANGNDLNAYAYAWNNPLTLRDISGLGLFGDIGRAIGNALGGFGRGLGDLWHGVTDFVGRNWREIVTIAVVIVVTAYTAGTGTPAVLAGAAGGAAGAATATALHGGSLSDVVGSAIVGAILGGAGGAIGGSSLGTTGKAIGFGSITGARAAIGGGDFGRGFLIGVISAGIDSQHFVEGNSTMDTAARIAIGATANGTVSELSGDGFGNGAVTGAFFELWRDAKANNWTRIEQVSRVVGMYQARDATLIGLGAGAVLYGYTSLFKDGAMSVKFEGGAVLISSNRGVTTGEGVTFGNTVLYGPEARQSHTDALVRHEMTHVVQWGAFGSQGFWDHYYRQVTMRGYWDAPFEAEARTNE